jgi:hypothetical protein
MEYKNQLHRIKRVVLMIQSFTAGKAWWWSTLKLERTGQTTLRLCICANNMNCDSCVEKKYIGQQLKVSLTVYWNYILAETINGACVNTHSYPTWIRRTSPVHSGVMICNCVLRQEREKSTGRSVHFPLAVVWPLDVYESGKYYHPT